MVLNVSHLSLSLDENREPLFEDIGFSLDSGEIAYVKGGAGSGKTMLGLAVCGFLPLATSYWQLEGNIELFGRKVIQGEPSGAVGVVLDNPSTQLSGIKSTVRQEMAFPLESIGVKPSEISDRIEAIAAEFGVSALLDRFLKTLSGGELQRVLIAAALIARPRFLYLDRPLTEIDETFRPAALAILKKYISENDGAGILVEEPWMLPDSHFAKTVCLAGENGMILPLPVSRLTSGKEGTAALEVKDVTFSYNGAVPVIDRLSFEVSKGEMAFITGVNGSGKTTLAKVITGLLHQSEGTIAVGGRNVDGMKGCERLNRIGCTLQNPDTQLCRKTVREEFDISEKHGISSGDCVGILGLDRLYDRHPFELTRAQKKRLVTALACGSPREVIILDEPSQYQDADGFARIVDAILHCLDRGAAVLVISHDPRFFKTFPEAAKITLEKRTK